MQRRQFTTGVWGVMAGLGLAPQPGGAAGFGQDDAAQAIRLAMERGAEVAVGLLGREGGFMGNDKVRIPLPGALSDAAKMLKFTGQQKKVDALVAAMNHAAELAVPQARELLVGAVKSMSVSDAVRIVQGGDASVTEFFAQRTRAPLTERFLPIVTEATERVALADKYNAVAGKASGLGLVRKEDANLQSYVTRKALDGLYLMIGEEERKIRRDPVGTGSELLRKVFG